MGNITDITEELAVALHTAITQHRVDFVEGMIPQNPASRYPIVNTLLYSSPLLSHDDGKLHNDGKRRINFCNYEAAKIFGLTIEEMLGMPSEELAPNQGNIREERARALQDSLNQDRLLMLQNEIRWQWQPDRSKREILIDAKVFPYQHKGEPSNAASIRFKGYYQPKVANHP